MRKYILLTGILVLVILILIWIFYTLRIEDEPVKINLPPVITGIQPQVIDEGGTFPLIDLKDYVADSDDDISQIKISIRHTGNLIITLSGNNIIEAAPPDKEWSGNDTLYITAIDAEGLTSQSAVEFIVNPVNDRPKISKIPGQSIHEGEVFAPIFLNDFIFDIDNSPEEISWIVLGKTLVDIDIDSENIAHIRPKNKDIFGTDTLLFIASDTGHLAATSRAVFNITPVNDSPTIESIKLPGISEGEKFPLIDLNELASDIDTPKDILKFDVGEGKFLSASIADNMLSIIQPGTDWYGVDTLTISVSDREYRVTGEIIAEVLPVNDTPLLKQIPNQTIKEDDHFEKILLNNFVSDVDNDIAELRWSISGNTLVDLRIDNDILHIMPRDDLYGSDTVTVTVTDPGNLSASTKVILTIVEKTFWERSPFKEIKTVAYTGVDDILSLAVSPYFWDKPDFIKLGILTGTTAILTGIDKNIQSEVMRDQKFANSDFLQLGEYYGRNTTSIGASIGFFGAGLIANEPELMQIGLEIIESYVIVNEFTSFLKNSFGRERPYNGTLATNFYPFKQKGHAYRSMPSGHTSVAFSLSSVLAAHTDNILLKSIIFTPAVVTAVQRIYSNNHWTSDVILGGAIGYVIGNYIVGLHEKKKPDNIILSINPNGELGIIYKFH